MGTRDSIYYRGGTHELPVAPDAAVVVLGVAGPVAARAPSGRRIFVAEYALSAAPGAPLRARLTASGFRSAAGAWASVEDFDVCGRPAAWTRVPEEGGTRVPVPEDGAVAIAWSEGGATSALRACVVARAADDESALGAALKDGTFDAAAPGAALLAAVGSPALGSVRAALVTAPGAPHRVRLCANRDKLRAFAVGWFGAQLSALGPENEKVFSAFDKARSCLDDR
ncbi:virion protein [Bovine papular stomatitis virus]|uniref:Virion protein n=1 Tax=Bovine papular stomatitis virus TaxID=129727 RepID=A0A0E3T725_9POXV|nr:virion protein [Bovine papular stomatitis virus]